MFPITRPHRQAAATLAVVVSAMLPTAYVVATAWKIGLASHRAEAAAEIGRRFGFLVSLEGIRYPRPGEVLYTGVVLRQEEPRGKAVTEVGRASSVRVRRGSGELTIATEGLRLKAESPRLAMARVDALLQRSGEAQDRVTLTAPTLDLDLGAGVPPYHLREVVGAFHPDATTPKLQASYRVSHHESSTRCELALSRDRGAEPVRTTLTFQTMEGLPLPAVVLDPFFDAESWLGRDATVDGKLTLRQDGGSDWEAEFQGNLHEVDLTELVERRFPTHKLEAKARLSLQWARWADRPGQGFGWVEARGELSSGPGMVGFGLLQALRTEMNFQAGPRLARIVSTGQVELDYQAMALSFAMNPEGEIVIKGALGNEYPEGTVFAGATAPLALAPEGAANVRGLIKTLFPVTRINHAVMVPLTEKSRLLLCLPVPPDLKSQPMGGN